MSGSTLVTGSSGFVGAALCAALAARGDAVVGLDRHPPTAAFAAASAGRPGTFRFVPGDLTRPGTLDRAFEGRIDRVVIAAAITADRARERRDPAGVAAVNVAAVAETIRCAAAAGVGRIVHLSSGAVYGDGARGAALLEEDATPTRPASLYAITKLAGEAVALRLGETFGLDIVVGRLGTCFGPFERETGARDTLSAPWQVLRHAASGTVVRLPRPGRKDWLYVRDAVAAVAALLDAPRPLPRRVYNLSAGFAWSIAQWCAALERACPGLDWSIGPDANVTLYEDVDRPPMCNARLLADTAFRPAFGLARALADHLASEPGLRAAIERGLEAGRSDA